MSINRYAKRADTTTQRIVEDLRSMGYSVVYIGLPVDLAVHHRKWGANVWRFLECKSRRLKNGNVALDKRQARQAEFCADHGVPYVTDTFEALLALGEKIQL